MFSKGTTALVFPGQGSQKIGMGQEFYESSLTKNLFEQANDALSFNLSKLMLQGDTAELSRTANTQPALLLTSYAAFSYLKAQTNMELTQMSGMVAGHSLGEYSALAAADVFDFETALKLVRKRGEAMQNAVKEGEGAMVAVLGLTYDDIHAIASTAGCFVANDNSDGQVVLSGTVESIEKASEMATAKGAKRVVRLPVSAPFHCPLMKPAADVMATELEAATMQNASLPIICNVTAAAEITADKLRQNLVSQVTGSVRWRESMIHLADKGITDIYELGTGKVLTGLAKRCDARLKGTALNTPAQIDNLLEALLKNNEIAS
ncbi:MAG: [acyl-carrier-protein] S-malonyltransferase [Alphaproteobacteria bacterium]|jgi:[acyl-carrier-protein] S-malonyltransferase